MRTRLSVLHGRYTLELIVAVVFISSAAVPLDAEPVVWSWEQELEPLDIVEYVADLPYDEWVEIDEVTCRRLFEDLIQRALDQMELEQGNGREFEQLIRQKLLYFTPEFEYYWSWPTYPKDTESAVVRFPVWIKRTKTTVYERGDADAVSFSLGRKYDDSRRCNAIFLEQQLISISSHRYRYLPGVLGESKIEYLSLAWQAKTNSRITHFNTRYYNQKDGSIFHNGSFYDKKSENGNPLLVFGVGYSSPIEDNRPSNQPELEIFGIEQLFTDRSLEFYYENPEAYGAWYPQAIRGIVNLCKLQLGLEHNGFELEKVLRRDFLEYVPWPPLDEDAFYSNTEAAIELVGIMRSPSEDVVVVYEFTIASTQGRYVYVIFNKEWGQVIDDYEWGIKQISYIQPVELEYYDQDGNRKEGVGDLTRLFKFTTDDAGGVIAEYYQEMLAPGGWLLTLRPEGYVITPHKETSPIAYFHEGSPELHLYGE